MVNPTLVPTAPTAPISQAVPLPQRQLPMAPHFNSKTPMTLCTYLLDHESLAEAAQLTPGECDSLNRAYKKSIHLELQDKICFISQTKRHLVSREKHWWSSMSGKEPKTSWKALIINTRNPGPQPHLDPLHPHQ